MVANKDSETRIAEAMNRIIHELNLVKVLHYVKRKPFKLDLLLAQQAHVKGCVMSTAALLYAKVVSEPASPYSLIPIGNSLVISVLF